MCNLGSCDQHMTINIKCIFSFVLLDIVVGTGSPLNSYTPYAGTLTCSNKHQGANVSMPKQQLQYQTPHAGTLTCSNKHQSTNVSSTLTCPNNSSSIRHPMQAHSHAQTSISAPMSGAHLHAQTTAPASEHSHVLDTPCRHPHMPNKSSSTRAH